MIAILDYDAGNIKSVEKALHFLGEETVVSRNREEIMAADKVILPGVGSFGDAMGKLREYGLDAVIHEVVDAGTPFSASAWAFSCCLREAMSHREFRGLAY